MSGATQRGRTVAADKAAADWYARIRLGAPTAHERQAFDEWMTRDESHARAYQAYEKLWGALGPMGADPDIAAARRGLMASAGEHRLRRATWRGASIAAAAVLAVVAVGLLTLRQTQNPAVIAGDTFTTAIGQYSTVPLEDGSTVILNTNSEIQPVYTGTERGVKLLRGQALFEVAANPSRPFVVYAGDRRIVALGTSFDVRLESSGVRVTLVEGRVAVDEIAALAPSRPTELSPGQQLVAEQGRDVEVRSTDTASVTSWREGRLLFSNAALSDAVAEVNRYSRTKIVIADPELAQLSLSGVFRTGQTEGFIAALETRFPLHITERTAERIVIVPGRDPL